MTKKILYIEDELDQIKMMGIRLEACGFEVVSASNGEEGLRKAREEKPDLVLLDIIMPRVDGYEVCKRLKQDPNTRDIPIVVISASGAKDLEEKSLNLGVEAVIRKPFETGKLLKIINGQLKKERK